MPHSGATGQGIINAIVSPQTYKMPMNEPTLTPEQLEKQKVDEIISRLACLMLATSKFKSVVQKHADKLRGQILAGCNDQQTRDAFLDSRNILTELASLLARCQDRKQLAKALSYLKALSAGDVRIAEDDPRENIMRDHLAAYLITHSEWAGGILEDELTEIINIVRFVGVDPIG